MKNHDWLKINTHENFIYCEQIHKTQDTTSQKPLKPRWQSLPHRRPIVLHKNQLHTPTRSSRVVEKEQEEDGRSLPEIVLGSPDLWEKRERELRIERRDIERTKTNRAQRERRVGGEKFSNKTDFVFSRKIN